MPRSLKATLMAANKGLNKSEKGKDTSTEKAKKDFQWTDDEAELLLNITNDYKATKAVDMWTGNP